ncbi:MAG: rhomboid family intramembrane serine protease, partial [Bacteroidota bacterium]
MNRITPVVKNLLILNTIVFVIDVVTNGMLNRFLSLKFVLADDFIVIQFLSYMWLHGDIFHLLFNMIALFFFGPILEQLWGGKKFLQFYVITGVGAGLLYGLVNFGMIYQDIAASDKYLQDPSSAAFNEYLYQDMSNQGLKRLNKSLLAELNND